MAPRDPIPFSALQDPALMHRSETPHALLRRATQPWHDAVEAAFAGYDLLTPEGLGAFLRAQGSAVLPIEGELDRRGMIELMPDWPSRRRSEALLSDLERLGSPAPADFGAPPVLDTPARRLGALYVLEGSRLGGRFLAQRIATSLVPAVRGANAYLGHRVHPGAWAGFLETLDRSGVDRAELLGGAEAGFRLFHDAAERYAP